MGRIRDMGELGLGYSQLTPIMGGLRGVRAWVLGRLVGVERSEIGVGQLCGVW